MPEPTLADQVAAPDLSTKEGLDIAIEALRRCVRMKGFSSEVRTELLRQYTQLYVQRKKLFPQKAKKAKKVSIKCQLRG